MHIASSTYTDVTVDHRVRLRHNNADHRDRCYRCLHMLNVLVTARSETRNHPEIQCEKSRSRATEKRRRWRKGSVWRCANGCPVIRPHTTG